MSNISGLSLFIFFTCLTMSCKPVPFIPGQSDTNYLRFGNGGGFTGAVTAYYLTENGTLYQENGQKADRMATCDPAWTRQMFLIPGILHAQDKPYNMPGNRYFFIEYSIDGLKQTITWGGEPMPIKAYETWYKNLMHEVKIKNLSKEKNVE